LASIVFKIGTPLISENVHGSKNSKENSVSVLFLSLEVFFVLGLGHQAFQFGFVAQLHLEEPTVVVG
jgi:hypothetical protein